MTVDVTGEQRAMRRVSIAMFVGGGITCMLGATTVLGTATAKREQVAIGAALLVSGVTIWALRRPGNAVYDASVLWGVSLISTLVAIANPLGRGDFFYLWPIVFAAYFCSTRILVGGYVWMLVTFALALERHPDYPTKLDTFLGTATTVGLMAIVVATLTRRETRLRRQLADAAEIDPLTGLLNRRSFSPRFEECVADAAVTARPLSVVMFDLDHFKRLNDQHGHLAGDEALQVVGHVLRSQSRQDDLVCRFGGEEFAVALPGSGGTEAAAYAERVAAALRDAPVAGRLTLSISAGIASSNEGHSSAAVLLARADEALYAAKAGGRCRHATWSGDVVALGPVFG